MTDEQWKQAWALYNQTRNLPLQEQHSFVESASSDSLVVKQVITLLDESSSEPDEDPPDILPPMLIESGQQCGRYVIQERLGSGGMAETWSALDTELDRKVALKILKRATPEASSIADRFVQEAKAASALNHPNIVTVFEVVRYGQNLAMVMELVEGQSLRKMCRNPQPVWRVLRIAEQIGQALAAVHSHNILHRDIKPENIMIRDDGYIKVLDFGLARRLDSDSVTYPGMPSGTFRYMSPEQSRGRNLTSSSDIFSMGVVLHELLAGSHPFPGESAIEAMMAITSDEPRPLMEANPKVPPELAALIGRMLTKDPGDRPTAPEVVAQIRALEKQDSQAIAAPADARRKAWMPYVWVGAGMLCVAALAGWLLLGRQPRNREQIALPTESEVVSAVAPDDPIPPRHIYGVTPSGGLNLYVDDSKDSGGFATWIAQSVAGPPLKDVNLASFSSLIAGGDGVLYGIGQDSSVTYFRIVDPWRNKGPLRWSSDSNTVIGKLGGDFKQLAALSRPVLTVSELQSKPSGAEVVSDTLLIRGGLIWAKEPGGATRLFHHGWKLGGQPGELSDWSHPTSNPPANAPALELRGPTLPPGEKCPDCRLLEGGTGIQYAITGNGRLLRYRRRAGDRDWVKAVGQFKWSEFATEVGHDWQGFRTVLSEPGEYGITGYVSTERTAVGGKRASMSLEPGDVVRVLASTFSPSYTVRLLRLQRHRWDDSSKASGLIEGVQVGDPVKLEAPAGGNFKKPEYSGMHRQGAGWTSDGADVRLPRNARSGIYAAELTTPSGSRFMAPFVVKPRPDQHNQIAMIANTSTWNAYNQWGGGSRVASFQTVAAGEPYELSYERPMLNAPPFGGVSASTGLTDRGKREFNQLVRAEVWITSLLEGFASVDPKYDFDVFSDVDLDTGIPNLAGYKALILQTRPEFWTDRMRDQLDEYLKSGGHLIYLAGQGLRERVTIAANGRLRFDKGPGSGCSLVRTDIDQIACPALNLFRWPTASQPDGRSERAVLGLASDSLDPTISLPGRDAHFVVAAAHPFLLQRTGMQVGSRFGQMRGINGNLPIIDGITNSHYSPGACAETPTRSNEEAKLVGNRACGASHTTLAGMLLAYSEPNNGFAPVTAASVVFRKTEKGWVFSIGSISVGGVLAVDPTLQRIVRNALDDALGVSDR